MPRRTGLLVAPFFAMQFLTVAPPVIRRSPSKEELGAAEAFFPLVGILLGAVLAGADLIMARALDPVIRDVLLVALLAAMTGALHLDGVADTFDGLFGGKDPESRLAIMRDPRIGAYGMVAVTLVLVSKIAALGAITEAMRPFALLLFPSVGRWAIVQATWSFPYARPEGLGRQFKDGMRARHLGIAAAITAATSGFCFGIAGITLLLVGCGAIWLAGRLIAGRLGGLTGDVYGAICELTEVVSLLALGARGLAWSQA